MCAAAPAAMANRAHAGNPVDVLTYHNDNMRSGLNGGESVLTPANVNAGTFGKLLSYHVDGAIYAEPLYVSRLFIPGTGIRNVVYVATEHDSVYAFFAAGAGMLWHASFINPPAVTTVSTTDVSCKLIVPEIGITGTPVIDRATQTLYVVSKAKGRRAGFFYQLHALDLVSGAEKFGGPKTIAASVAGSGYDNVNGSVSFNPLTAHQRSALLLSGGVVYIAFASNCDVGRYHGWVLAYDAATLNQVAVFNTTPNGQRGGIWQSGNGPSASSLGYIFAGIGNGTFDADQPGGADYGDSFVRLDPKTLAPLDFFTASDQARLEVADADAGSTGTVLLPNQPGPAPLEMVGGGKDGTLYVLNLNSMGHFCPPPCNNSQVVQQIVGQLRALLSAPAYWNTFVYLIPSNGRLRAFSLHSGMLSSEPVNRSAINFGIEGASPAVSANGSANGIVWAIKANGGYGPRATLYAFDASDISRELYGSDQAPNGRDTAGPAVKFTVPTVADGRVYVGTRSEIDVYGLLPP